MQNFKFITILLIASLISIQLSAQSIYRCSRNGKVTFTNVKAEAKGCKRIKIVVPPSAFGIGQSTPPKNFPRVSNKTQRARDKDRDHLIRQELANEREQFALLKKRMEDFQIVGGDDQQQQIEQIKLLNEEKSIRAKNIEELEKQLNQ